MPSPPNYLLPFEFEYSLGDYEFNVEVGRWFSHERANDSWFAAADSDLANRLCLHAVDQR